MDIAKFNTLLARVKEKAAADALVGVIAMQDVPVTHVDVSSLGLPNSSTDSEDGDAERDGDEAASILEDVGRNILEQNRNEITEANNDTLPGTSNSEAGAFQGSSGDALDEEHNVDAAEALPTQPILGVTRDIILNNKQSKFHDIVISGKSCVMIGAAGTGKTTAMRKVTRSLIDEDCLPKMQASTKWLKAGHYGAAILSFTNKAVNNIRHAVVEELKPHTITAHKLLEFQPVFFEEIDEKGISKNTMRFEPTKTKLNPLPSSLAFLAWEESSMISVHLYNLVQDAMPHEHQEVFLGDIQQLPPVFGLAVLGFKMNELPTVELTEIYRQAAGSPIISLAWDILRGDSKKFKSDYHSITITSPATGKKVQRKVFDTLAKLSIDAGELGSVMFQPWQHTLDEDMAINVFSQQVYTWIKNGYYDPEEDIILCPFNVGVGTIEINKRISNHLGRKREAKVWEVIAGFKKHYLAVGDRVLFDKEDAAIISISHNGSYMGTQPQMADPLLDRWGALQDGADQGEELEQHKIDAKEREEAALEDFFSDDSGLGGSGDVEDRVNSASHIVVVKLRYSDEEKVLSTASEINNLLGGYAITIHKAQGSEYDTVILCLQKKHAPHVNRELLYTAVTRAKKKLHIVCEADTFEKGVLSQRIKGDTLAEKAEWFKGKAVKGEDEREVPLLSYSSLHSVTRSPEARKEEILQANIPMVVANKVEESNKSAEEAIVKVEEQEEKPLTTMQKLAQIKALLGRAS